MRSRNWLLLAFVVIGSVLFCMQDMWLVRDLDDYAFSTINELRVNELGEPYMVHERPVLSLADALASQRVAFVHYNGRFLIHSLSQWFNSTDSTTPAIIFNTLSWALLIACFVLLAYGRKRLDVPLLVIAFAVLWLTMPSSLWMMLGAITAAADYLWTGAANLFVLWIFYRITRGCYKSSWLKTLLIGVCALLAAAMQESFSIGISAGLIVYCMLNRKRLSRDVWVLVICYLIGTALVTMAPANFKRSDMMGHMIRWYALIDLMRAPIMPLTLLTAAIMLVMKPAELFRIFKQNIVLVVALVVNLLFAVLIAYTGAWQLTCVTLFSAILFLQMLPFFLGGKVAKKVIAVVAAIAVIVVYSLQFNCRRDMWQVAQTMHRQALQGVGLLDLSRSYEIDEPYRQSALAPLYRQYLRNPFETMIINSQQTGVSSLSKFLTRCQQPELVKALLPESPDSIAGRFQPDACSRVGDADAVAVQSFTITRGDQDNADRLDGVIVPCQHWQYSGKYYKLYTKSASTLEQLIP